MTLNSSTSSTSDWPEPEVLHEELERWGETTAESESRVLRVGYVHSDDQTGGGVGSHLDLVLVMEEFDLPPAERVGMWDLGAVPVPAQTLVYTQEEWDELMETETPLSEKLKDGVVWVFER